MTKKNIDDPSQARLASPEQLDMLLKVTSPKGWLALLALGFFLITVMLWGIFGSIPTRVSGQGMLIKSGGVFQVVALSSGQLTAAYPDVEEIVEKGQTIARIAQPEIIEKIRTGTAELAEKKAEHQRLLEFVTEDLRKSKEHAASRRDNLKSSVQFARQRLQWLEDRQKDQKKLLEQGLITKQTFLNTQQEITSTQQDIETSKNQIEQIALDGFQLEDQKERQIRTSAQAISQKERELASLEEFYESNSRVVSPFSGRVLEVMKDAGATVVLGTPLLSLELVGAAIQNLEAVVFVSARDGKRVRPGMKAHISPSTVKQEEYGFILGMVTHVAEFPSTTQGMMRVLQNDSLVQTLSEGGAPIQIFANLLPDPGTKSGFKWSSPKGPPVTVQSGTMAAVTITLDEQPPISLVIPPLKRLLWGGEEQ